MNLNRTDLSYTLISKENTNGILSYLYSREYSILEMKKYDGGIFYDSVMSYGLNDNDELRKDVLFMLDKFDVDYAIIKYNGDSEPRKIYKNGVEKLLDIKMYETETESFIYKGLSFSFLEKKRYYKPKKQEDIKAGMVVEYLNNGKWFEKKVIDPKTEWEKMYGLLVKYDKLRIVN